MPATKTPTTAKGATSSTGKFSQAEVDAMKERAKELKAARKAGGEADGLTDLLAKIAEMPPEDKAIAERLHAIVMENAPSLEPRTWYGMPAWAKDGKALCFFTPAAKFKERYSSFGFNTGANLDEGTMWPTSWAITTLSPADEKAIAALVKKAAS